MTGRTPVAALAALGCYALALGQPPARSQPAPQTAGSSVQDAQAAAQRAEEAARAAVAAKGEAEKQRDETLKKLDTVSTEMIGRATALQTMATWVIGFVAFAVTVAGVLGVFAAFKGGSRLTESIKKVQEGEATAKEAAAKIVEIKEGLDRHKLSLDNLQQHVTAALEEIGSKLELEVDQLTPGTLLIGVSLAAAVPQRFYDDDALIVFSDRLKITEGSNSVQLAKSFVNLGNYWRRWKEYGRSIERIRRAMELDPSSATAHKTLGRAIWNGVAEALAASNTTTISPDQRALLEEAEAELEEAQKLLSGTGQHDEEIPYDLGTISRFKGDIPQAIDHYQRGAQLSKAFARTEGREPDWDYEFALACLYAKTNQYQQALDELKGLIGKTQSWNKDRRRVENRNYRDWARSDPDFAEMLADPTWAPQIRAL